MGTTAEKLAYLSETKASIKNAIVAKGVEVPEGTTFRGYADLISGISTGLSDADLALANATPEDVFAGKTFYAGNRELRTGTASAAEIGVVRSGSVTAATNYYTYITPPDGWVFATFTWSTGSPFEKGTFCGGIAPKNTDFGSGSGFTGYLSFLYAGASTARIWVNTSGKITIYNNNSPTPPLYISYEIYGFA